MSITKQKLQEATTFKTEDPIQLNQNKIKTLENQDAAYQEKENDLLEMPAQLNQAKLAKEDDPGDFEEEHEEEYQVQEESVAMNGRYQYVNNKFFGGDGHYMKKLKNELNEGAVLRAEENAEIPAVDYTVKMIKEVINEGTLDHIQKKMENIISVCKRYRFFHPFPLSKEGKKRKAEVKKVEESARQRLKVCEERKKELKEGSEKSGLYKKSGNTYTERAEGWKAHMIAAPAFVFLNIWNTIGMIPSAIVWSVASTVKSIKEKKPTSAFPIPHPHSYKNWYQRAVSQRRSSIMAQENDHEMTQQEQKSRLIYEQPRMRMKWYNYLAMK